VFKGVLVLRVSSEVVNVIVCAFPEVNQTTKEELVTRAKNFIEASKSVWSDVKFDLLDVVKSFQLGQEKAATLTVDETKSQPQKNQTKKKHKKKHKKRH
jgi:ribosome recycling factor